MHTEQPKKESNNKVIKNAEPKSPLTGQMCVLCETEDSCSHHVVGECKTRFGGLQLPFWQQEAPDNSCGHCTVSSSLKGINFRDKF